jgi:hypothetical protein
MNSKNEILKSNWKSDVYPRGYAQCIWGGRGTVTRTALHGYRWIGIETDRLWPCEYKGFSCQHGYNRTFTSIFPTIHQTLSIGR